MTHFMVKWNYHTPLFAVKSLESRFHSKGLCYEFVDCYYILVD